MKIINISLKLNYIGYNLYLIFLLNILKNKNKKITI